MSQRAQSLTGAALLLGFAAALVVFTQSLDIGAPSRMGPRFFPLVVAGLLVLYATLIVAQALLARSISGDEERHRVPIGLALRNLGVIAAAILLFGHGIRELGLVVVAGAVTLLTGLLLARMRLFEALVYSALVTVGSVLLFRIALNLSLPIWPL